MKNLYQSNRGLDRVNARFVWMSGGPEDMEGESRLLPSNPLKFGYSDIASFKRELRERPSKKLTGAEQRDFGAIVNHQLKKVETETEDSATSRTLFAIFRDPQLNSLLTSSQRRAIEKLLSKERKEIIQISKTQPSSWSQDQAIKVARTYRSIRHKVNTESIIIDEKLRDIGDKLKIYGAQLSRKESRLSPKENLFVLELNRLFPSESDWKNPEVARSLKAKADVIRAGLIRAIEDRSDIPSTAKHYWDLLVDEVDGGDASPALKSFLKQSQEVDNLSLLVRRFEHAKGRIVTTQECRFLLELSAGADETYEFSDRELEEAYEEPLKEAREKLSKADEKRSKELAEIRALTITARVDLLDKNSELRDQVKENLELLSDTWSGEEDSDEGKKRKKIINEIEEEALSVDAREKNINTLKADLQILENKLKDESSVSKTDVKVFSKTKSEADRLLADYKKDLLQRIKDQQTVSSDVLTLIELSNDEVALVGGEPLLRRKDLVLAIRTQIKEKLGAALTIDFDADSFSEADIDKINKGLNYAQALGALSDPKSPELESLTSFEKRQTVEAVVQNLRKAVFDKLAGTKTVSGAPVVTDFINHYHREHHRLSQNDLVVDCLNHTSNLEKEKKANQAKYEHAYEKVQSLFADGERSLIIVDLNKILKTSESGEEVYDSMEGELLPDKSIFQYSPTEIAKLEKSITIILKSKVKDEFADDRVLEETAKSLISRLNRGQAQVIAQDGMQASLHSLNTSTDKYRWMTLEDRHYLSQATYPISRQVVKDTEKFRGYIDDLMSVLAKEDEQDIEKSVFDLQTAYSGEFKPALEKAVAEFKAELSAHFSPLPDGATKFIEEITNQLEDIDRKINTLVSNKGDLSAFDAGFESLRKDIDNVQHLFDIDKGAIGESTEKEFETTIANAAETQNFINDELELFGPGGIDKARRNFEKKRKEHQEIVDEYAQALEPVAKLIERDLGNFNDNDFKLRHLMSKTEARQRLKNMKQNKEDAEGLMTTFNGENPAWGGGGKGAIFDQWVEWYKDPEQHGNALRFMNSFNIFGKELKSEKFPEMTQEMNKWHKDYKNNMPLIPFMKNKYRLTLEWYTLKSIYMMVQYAWEKSARNRERRNEQHMAKLGEKMFGDSRLGREFKREANEKEKERVDDWKGSYGDFDVPKLKKVIEGVKTIAEKDQARAAIELLIEKGELSIDSPIFLNVLNRLSGRTIFDQSDIEGYAQNQDILIRKVGEVFTDIWDRPTWIQTKEDFGSKYDSAMKNHESDVSQEVFTGGVDTYLIRSLDNWEKGTPDDDFERARFEQYLKGAIEAGVMNGYPGGGDRRLFYMIKAVTTKNPNTGETLLSLRAINRFAELMGNIPYLDGLDDGGTWKKDGKVVPPNTPGAHEGSWNYHDIQCWGEYFKDIPISSMNFGDIKSGGGSTPALKAAVRKWFNEVLVPTDDAQDRITKVEFSKIDHDDAGNLPLLVSPEKAKDSFNYNSGEVRQVTEKFQVNFMGSFDTNLQDTKDYLKMISENYKDSPDYQKFMEGQLERFGQMLRIYFMASHQFAGNWDFVSAVGSLALSDNEWNKNELQGSHDRIQDIIYELTGNQGIENNDLKKRRNVSKSSGNKKYLELKKGSFADPTHYDAVGTIEQIYNDKEIFKDHAKLAKIAGISF